MNSAFRSRFVRIWLLLMVAALSACAPQAGRLASTPVERPVWAFEHSDIPAEPEYRFGQLPNGMRYVIRNNPTPKGTALVRLDIGAGSLDEQPAERGFAHFVEHMVFNGSANVPEGEMIRLLERNGLAFGADTNASTGFEATTYKLDLPRNDPTLLDTALMLMRETVSELSFTPEAVARERGVVLAEMRDRNSWQLRNAMAQARFLYPQALYPQRFPIGVEQTVAMASAEALKAFWRREYVPAKTTLVVIGDFDPDHVEDVIAMRFAGWESAEAPPQPDAGPVDRKARDRVDIYIDPALSERVVVSRHGAWIQQPDSVATRRENILRQIGYGIVNRRLQRISRQENPPFRDAGFGTGDVFRSGRTTNLVIDTVDGKWRAGLIATALEYRRALANGFTAAEVAEQVANLRAASVNAAAGSATRSNGALVNAVFQFLRDDRVPSAPDGSLQRLDAFIPLITPDSVLDSLKREAVPLERPLIRFQGRMMPIGGEAALREAWDDAMDKPLGKADAVEVAGFGYENFGEPGSVAGDTREPLLGIREVRFANGVRLNIKRTELEKDGVFVQMTLDGGDMLATRDNPLATQMVSMLPSGGLGKHSQDELQSILAGRIVGTGITSGTDSFVSLAQTTPADLELQLRLFAAMLGDPGYRKIGETRYRLNINNYFNRRRATPGAALASEIGGILSDDNPRFSLGKVEDYRKLTFDKLKHDLADRFAHGAIELGVVGDVDEDEVIAQVSRTLGALPPREPEFRPYIEQRIRLFTAKRDQRIVRHTGPKDQALIQLVWPTRGDDDPVETLMLRLLERIVRLEMTDILRERLGKAYSPSVSSAPSRYWLGYGTFGIAASVDVRDVTATQAAIMHAIAGLRAAPIAADMLQRAREPMIEAWDNALKSNASWLSLVDRAQTEPERIERYLKEKERLQALTALDVQAMARRYLDPAGAVEILVLPEGVDVPKE